MPDAVQWAETHRTRLNENKMTLLLTSFAQVGNLLLAGVGLEKGGRVKTIDSAGVKWKHLQNCTLLELCSFMADLGIYGLESGVDHGEIWYSISIGGEMAITAEGARLRHISVGEFENVEVRT